MLTPSPRSALALAATTVTLIHELATAARITIPSVNVIGFDDGPFRRDRGGRVLLVGAVCASTRLDGIVSGHVMRDGSDAARRMIELVRGSQFRSHVRAVLLQGIAVAGFNVVDVHTLAAELAVPVLVIMRRPPDLAAIERALLAPAAPGRTPRLRGGARKWRLIQRAGEIERLDLARSPTSGLRAVPHRLWVQRVGLTLEQARRLVANTTLHGHVPEPLRLAHLIAGGITTGKSRHRA